MGSMWISMYKTSCKLLTIPGSVTPVELNLPETIGLILGVLVVIVTITIALIAVLAVKLSRFIRQSIQNVFNYIICFVLPIGAHKSKRKRCYDQGIHIFCNLS